MWMWQSNAAHNYRSGFLLSLTAAAHATVVHVSSGFHLTGKKTGQNRGAFSAPVACKIFNIRCVFKKKKD